MAGAARVIPLAPRPLRGVPAAPPAPPPLALYVHIPWCVRKCPYCDFNSHALREQIPEDAYIDALLADLETALPQVWGRPIVSVFFGGGTPSLLSAAGVERLLSGIRMLLPLEAGAEITLEANPGSVEAARYAEFRAAGINRLSIGVQSFDDAKLAALGRVHDAAAARRALEQAARHFDTWNLDLMYALPQQSLAEAESDLEQALDWAPPHLSCYHLTLEPNTAFAHAPPPLPDPDLAADMQDMIEARLARAGYQHYEISAFARPGHRCRHNLNYWHFGDYLGIGAGAHGKLSSARGIVREMRHRHPDAYLAGAARGDFVHERREVSAAELPFEFMMNALRLLDGVPRALYPAHTGLALDDLAPQLRAAVAAGLLDVADPERLRPSRQGRHFLNELLQRFLP